MKVYLFDPDSGLYEGADYCEATEICEDDGITALPPPANKPGQVPVYDRVLRNWKLVSTNCFSKLEK